MKTKKVDVQTRVTLKEKIERRKAFLKHLRRMDYKRFEWVLEKNDLVFHLDPKYLSLLLSGLSLESNRPPCLYVQSDRSSNQERRFDAVDGGLLRKDPQRAHRGLQEGAGSWKEAIPSRERVPSEVDRTRREGSGSQELMVYNLQMLISSEKIKTLLQTTQRFTSISL